MSFLTSESSEDSTHLVICFLADCQFTDWLYGDPLTLEGQLAVISRQRHQARFTPGKPQSLSCCPAQVIAFLWSFLSLSMSKSYTKADHDTAVAAISRHVHDFHLRQTPFRIYHGSSSSTNPPNLDPTQIIDTTSLTHILSISAERKTALVEPNVSMRALVAAALEYNLVPLVVMELPSITVGGGFAGTSGESSSFKHGCFDQTINWFEMVLPTGEIVNASPTEREDLFNGAASSFGTLGITTLVEVQLVDAGKYVKLTYHPVFSAEEAIEKIEEYVNDGKGIEYLDGIMYTKDTGVIMTGTFADDPESFKITSFSRPHDPWFYLHARKYLDRSYISNLNTECIPTASYLFRYDRGAFWGGYYAFKYFFTPFNRLTRFLLNPFMDSATMYSALHQSNLASQYIIQDIGIPYPNCVSFLSYLNEKFGSYPLWLCPIKTSRSTKHYTLVGAASPDVDHLLNFGIWGPGPKDRKEFVRLNREIETKVRELGGQKTLYARAYYTKEEFAEIYDGERYDVLREKYGAGYLKSIWEKVGGGHVEDEEVEGWRGWVLRNRPWAGLYGVVKLLIGKEYLLGSRNRRRRSGKGKTD
ncbi:hypothetical protein ACMFMF_011385 [Clarireedia jacksonii]